jgi:hypothetical protein
MLMRADDLRFDELFTFRDGVIDFQGRRLVLHSTDAFAQFRKDLYEMVGARRAGSSRATPISGDKPTRRPCAGCSPGAIPWSS